MALVQYMVDIYNHLGSLYRFLVAEYDGVSSKHQLVDGGTA